METILPRLRQALIVMAAVIGGLWVIELIDTATRHALDAFGILPRQLDGLDGILFAPLLPRRGCRRGWSPGSSAPCRLW